MIVALMKETIDSSEFDNFYAMKKKYDFTLKLLSRKFQDRFIQNLLEDPYYLEIKLNMIQFFIPNYCLGSSNLLLKTFEELFRRIRTKKENIWVTNS